MRNPDQFDALRVDPALVPAVARHPAGHVAFGHGLRHCVGVPPARLEAQIAFTQLVRRFLRSSLAGDVRWRDGIRSHGLVELPVRPNE
ncbi:cytochrome P450 [Amycolatopsis sp. NPDC049252]|uniref:cytochrome P450 n=1 Tax=Amycolatopsis sp. NPDC049252 TaxID=3363933 RepID=UPI0037121753